MRVERQVVEYHNRVGRHAAARPRVTISVPIASATMSRTTAAPPTSARARRSSVISGSVCGGTGAGCRSDPPTVGAMPEEREIKVPVGMDFVLPDLDGVLEGIRAVDRGRVELSATYWDTDELTLLHAKLGLRYRSAPESRESGRSRPATAWSATPCLARRPTSRGRLSSHPMQPSR